MDPLLISAFVGYTTGALTSLAFRLVPNVEAAQSAATAEDRAEQEIHAFELHGLLAFLPGAVLSSLVWPLEVAKSFWRVTRVLFRAVVDLVDVDAFARQVVPIIAYSIPLVSGLAVGLTVVKLGGPMLLGMSAAILYTYALRRLMAR